MTRETKVGLVVATTFLCLVSLVVASKLRGPNTAEAAIAQAPPQEPAGTVEPCEPNPDKPPAPTTPLPTVPPSLTMNAKPFGDPLPKVIPQPAASQPVQVVDLPGVKSFPAAAPSQGGSWWGRYVQEGTAAIAGGNAGPGPVVPEPVAELPVVKVAQAQDPIQLPAVAPIVPLPAGDPPMGGGAKAIPLPAPLAGEPKQASGTQPITPIHLPEPPPDPIQVAPAPTFPTAPTAEGANGKQPAPSPLPIPIVPAPAGAVGVPVPAVQPKQMPPADPVMPEPPSATLPGAGAAPNATHIGTIGTTGNEAPVAPLPTPVLPGVGGPVPALPAAGSPLPKVVSHSDDVRRIDPGQTTFAQLSQRWYGSDKYAQALLEYNRRHLLNRSNADLQRDPPVLSANQPIYYPHPNVLESDFAAYIPKTAAPAAPSISGAPTVGISPPTPLNGSVAASTPAVDGTVSYRVPQTDHILRIAQQTLGNMDEWREIVRLNPSLRTDLPIPAGTLLRLPAKARAN